MTIYVDRKYLQECLALAMKYGFAITPRIADLDLPLCFDTDTRWVGLYPEVFYVEVVLTPIEQVEPLIQLSLL
jgi:hypothetical protein